MEVLGLGLRLHALEFKVWTHEQDWGYRSNSFIRKRAALGPYIRTILGALWWS